jgi:hypothetical protein
LEHAPCGINGGALSGMPLTAVDRSSHFVTNGTYIPRVE